MKVGATRVNHDVKLAIHAGADVIVVDGMQGGTAATQTVFIEHVGIPTLAAVRQAVEAIDDLNMRGKVQLIVSGGIRTGADVAKALAMGADAVAIGQARAHGAGLQQRQLSRRATSTFPRSRTTPGSAPRPGSAITATPAAARWASPRRIRCSSSAWTRPAAPGGSLTT